MDTCVIYGIADRILKEEIPLKKYSRVSFLVPLRMENGIRPCQAASRQ